MYVPKHFELTNPQQIAEFIHSYSFAVLFSQVDGAPFATHLPLLYDDAAQVLYGHVAKANRQWQQLDGQTVMAVFSGPHTYISPSWYEIPASVPTWNYLAVHVYGVANVIHQDAELGRILDDLVRYFEPESPLLGQSSEAFYENMKKAIVGFRIHITRIVGNAKMSQNKSVEVQERVVAKLADSPDADARSVAQWMNLRLDELRRTHLEQGKVD